MTHILMTIIVLFTAMLNVELNIIKPNDFIFQIYLIRKKSPKVYAVED